MCFRLHHSRCRQIILQHFGFARRWFSIGARPQRLPNFDRFVESIPLHRRAAGFADGFDHFGLSLQLRRGRAGHVKDVFLNDRPVQIVRAVAQRHLRQLQLQAHPVGRDVIEVVEVDAAHRDGAQRVERSRLFLATTGLF